ncbi:ADP-ribosylglycohydrolase [Aquisphaera giovannonii]|uniref:ADP-ribosylglycohydrolase n=1 Tax=Aquisphaera giovannonii TaxID=406548 RepID=A0A5B9WH36_9BACT|nr:ADP-ribosylglycohydrolase family protein [Aquisphaera giovannonii]QEH39150.1 ADP-ribosylglycohydrolase [Aquisphaera giovannonii]
MLGAIAGDVIGSVYEADPIKSTSFPLFHDPCRFTDDTVLTVALAESILDGTPYVSLLKSYYRRYPKAGYGGTFHRWALSPGSEPYGSFGNGSAMRVSPVGFAYDSLDEVLTKARESAEVTHDHPEGIKGAQAVAAAIFLARTGSTKDAIRDYVAAAFGYDLDRTIEDIRPRYCFDVTCQGSVPEAILAFLESNSYEHAVRLAISLGGDADTQACIAGGIAQAFYRGVPPEIAARVFEILDEPLAAVTRRFQERYEAAR